MKAKSNGSFLFERNFDAHRRRSIEKECAKLARGNGATVEVPSKFRFDIEPPDS
jgi:hypothetical protein